MVHMSAGPTNEHLEPQGTVRLSDFRLLHATLTDSMNKTDVCRRDEPPIREKDWGVCPAAAGGSVPRSFRSFVCRGSEASSPWLSPQPLTLHCCRDFIAAFSRPSSGSNSFYVRQGTLHSSVASDLAPTAVDVAGVRCWTVNKNNTHLFHGSSPQLTIVSCCIGRPTEERRLPVISLGIQPQAYHETFE